MHKNREINLGKTIFFKMGVYRESGKCYNILVNDT